MERLEEIKKRFEAITPENLGKVNLWYDSDRSLNEIQQKQIDDFFRNVIEDMGWLLEDEHRS